MLTTFAVLAASVSRGRIDQRNGGRAGLAEVGIAGGGFAVQRQAQDLADGLVRILRGGEALAVANREEQILAVGREGDRAAFLAAPALGHLAPQHLEVLQSGRGGSDVQPGAGQRQAAAIVTRLGIGEIDTLVGGVTGRDEDAQHAVLALPVDRRAYCRPSSSVPVGSPARRARPFR